MLEPAEKLLVSTSLKRYAAALLDAVVSGLIGLFAWAGTFITGLLILRALGFPTTHLKDEGDAWLIFFSVAAIFAADSLIVVLCPLILFLLFCTEAPEEFTRMHWYEHLNIFCAIAMSGVTNWLYHACQESSVAQATVGKRLFKLTVCDEKLQRIDFGRASLRHFSKILSFLPMGFGFIAHVVTERQQMFHDKIAGTLVRTKPLTQVDEELSKVPGSARTFGLADKYRFDRGVATFCLCGIILILIAVPLMREVTEPRVLVQSALAIGLLSGLFIFALLRMRWYSRANWVIETCQPRSVEALFRKGTFGPDTIRFDVHPQEGEPAITICYALIGIQDEYRELFNNKKIAADVFLDPLNHKALAVSIEGVAVPIYMNPFLPPL